MPDDPHFSFPFRMSGGAHAATVEQDSPDEVFGCARAILGTPEGLRLDLPAFGCRDQVLAAKVNTDDIASGLARFEPRAEYLVTSQPDFLDAAISHIQVEVGGTADA